MVVRAALCEADTSKDEVNATVPVCSIDLDGERVGEGGGVMGTDRDSVTTDSVGDLGIWTVRVVVKDAVFVPCDRVTG